MVFDGSGSFILPNSCAGLCEKSHHKSSRTCSTACEKWSICLADVGTWSSFVDGFQSAGSPLKGPNTSLCEPGPGPPVRPFKHKELGPFSELGTSNPGSEVPREAPEVAPNVSARGADIVDMRDDVAQRRASDAESIGGDEVREPRRRNSPSDPTSSADRACNFPIVVCSVCPKAGSSRETPG